MKIKLMAYLHLGRVGMSPLTVSVPILGLFTAVSSSSPPLSQILVSGMIGFCAHLFGFALNDIIDYPIDKNSPYRQRSPLVTGKLSFRQAWVFVLLQPMLILLLYWGGGDGTAVSFFILLLSFICSIAYNLWSKTGRIPRIFAELALASSVSLLCLASALTISSIPSMATMVFACTLGLVTLLLNSVPSGLKDIKADREAGGNSFVLALGCFVIAGDRLYISKKLQLFAFVLQTIIMGMVLFTAKQFFVPLMLQSIIFLLLTISFFHLIRMLMLSSYNQLRHGGPLLGGYCHYLALVLIVVSHFSIAQLLLVGLILLFVVALTLLWRGVRRRRKLVFTGG